MVILIPVLVAMMLFINRQYAASNRQVALRPDQIIPPPHREQRVVVPVSALNRAVVQAVNVARSMSDDVRAVYISDDQDDATAMRTDWERRVPGVPLVIVESPYRALVGPLLAYLDVLDRAWPPDKEEPITFVVIPEYVARNWWERILYNQSAKRLRTALLGRPHTVVVNVPYRREEANLFDHHDDDARSQRRPRAGRARTVGPRTRGGGIVTAASRAFHPRPGPPVRRGSHSATSTGSPPTGART